MRHFNVDKRDIGNILNIRCKVGEIFEFWGFCKWNNFELFKTMNPFKCWNYKTNSLVANSSQLFNIFVFVIILWFRKTFKNSQILMKNSNNVIKSGFNFFPFTIFKLNCHKCLHFSLWKFIKNLLLMKHFVEFFISFFHHLQMLSLHLFFAAMKWNNL